MSEETPGGSKGLLDSLKGLAASLIAIVHTRLELLSVDPRPPGAAMLRGGERGRWRVRVGDYRVVYVISDRELVVIVVRVAHRREVYR